MRLNAKQIAEYSGGTFQVAPIDASALLCDITWDSREAKKGCLYVALPGEKVDGHDFVGAALHAGALAALVSQPLPVETCQLAKELGAAIIEVPNTFSAITDLARAWRAHLTGKVIAITGSTGKTTTKNLVRDVLSARFSVVATQANQNNELGVPRTLLNANPETQVVVVEMGMRGRGQIKALCDFVKPDWGLITNAGESHIELLGSRENIARAKAELLDALPQEGSVVFLNDDCDMSGFIWHIGKHNKERCVRVDFNGSCDIDESLYVRYGNDGYTHRRVWARDITLDAQGCAEFTLVAFGFDDTWPPEKALENAECEKCHLSLRGVHNVSNACAAAAVGRMMGMDLPTIARALEASVAEAGRQEVLQTCAGVTVINDAYNANPDSMRAALSTFAALDVRGARVAVLGDMGELGEYAQACHEGVGAFAATLPLNRLICIGELARFIAQGALDGGMDAACVTQAQDIASVLGDLEASLQEGDAVLVKASHFMELTRIVEGLVS